MNSKEGYRDPILDSPILMAYREGVRDSRRSSRDEWTVRVLLILIAVIGSLVFMSWRSAETDRERLWRRQESFQVWIETTREIMIKQGVQGVPNVGSSMHEDPSQLGDGTSDEGAREPER